MKIGHRNRIEGDETTECVPAQSFTTIEKSLHASAQLLSESIDDLEKQLDRARAQIPALQQAGFTMCFGEHIVICKKPCGQMLRAGLHKQTCASARAQSKIVKAVSLL